MTRVLIVDDHPVVLQGFRRIVEDAGVEAIFEAGDPVSGYRLFHRVRPQVSVVDLAFRGSGLAGLSLIRRMCALEPKARILAFSMHRDPVIAARVLEAGASGYALKDLPPQDILDAFETVRDGRPYLPHSLATSIAQCTISPERDKHKALSAREIQVSVLLMEGKSYRSIANDLSISYSSVVNACHTIRKKLDVESKSDLIKELNGIYKMQLFIQ